MSPDDPEAPKPPTPRPSSPTEPGAAPPAPSPPPPERIGRYRVLVAIESGGMGRVYRAHDPQLDRVVALKVPRLEALREAPAVWAQRFLREAQSAARVRHPNVCPIYDVGEHDGTPFVVMAFIDGPSLAQCLREPSPYEHPAKAALLVRQVAEGLGAVHDCGLIHRDVKPGNILLDPKGQALLTDFGLARPEQDSEHLTASGVMVGTPAYMAPEQACGELGRVGPWTDLYSLGVVLYRLLAGRLPFVGPTTAVLWKIGNEVPPPPSDFRPGLDPALEGIVRKAMALRPEDRYRTARDFAADLDAWLAGKPAPFASAAPPPGAAGQGPDPSTPTRPYRRPFRKDEGGRMKDEGKQPRARSRFILHPSSFILPVAALLLLGFAALLVVWLLLPAGEGEAAGGAMALAAPAPGPADIQPEPLDLAPGAPLSAQALVVRPAPLRGVRAWTVETREPRGSVCAVAYRPDGRQVALAGEDGMVRILETGGGLLVRLLAAHGRPVRGLAWSPNGRFLASAGEDGLVCLWDADRGRLLRRLRRPTGAVYAVSWSPDGEALASGGADGRVRLWRAADGQALPGGAEHRGPVLAVAWSPDGRLVASAGGEAVVRLWDVGSGRALAPLKGHGPPPPVYALAWAPDSRTLASAGIDQRIRLWNVADGTNENTIEAGAPVTALAWARANELAASTANGVRVYDTAGRTLRSRPMRAGAIGALAWSPDGKVLATAGEDAVWFWEPATDKVGITVACHPAGRATAPHAPPGRAAVAWSPVGHILAIAGFSDSALRFWDADTGRFRADKADGPCDSTLAWSPGGKELAVAAGKTVRTWDEGARRWSGAALRHDSDVLALAWSPGGKSLAAGLGAGGVRLWQGDQPRDLPAAKNQPGGVLAVAWSPDGKLVAGGATGTLLFWAAAAGNPPQALEDRPGPLQALAWSPDGKLLASGEGFGTGRLRVWKSDHAVPRPPPRELPGHPGGVSACAWSADSKVLASAGVDGAVRFWEAASSRPLSVLEGYPAAVSSLSWRPGDETVASAGRDGTVRLGNRDGKGYRLLLVPLRFGGGLALTPEGHFAAPPNVESSLVVIVQSDQGQDVYSPAAFRDKFGWKNDPDRVRLGAK